jgi:glutamate synthase (ferredoxin)
MKWSDAPMCWSQRKPLSIGRPRDSTSRRFSIQPEVGPEVGRYCQIPQDHGLDKSLDITRCSICANGDREGRKSKSHACRFKKVNRVVGTILGNEITKRHWDGLPEDTVHLHFQAAAGQSLVPFVPKGVTLELEGDAMTTSEGTQRRKIILYPPVLPPLLQRENIIVGNVCYMVRTVARFISGAWQVSVSASATLA